MRTLTDDELYQHQITTGQEFNKLITKYMKGRGRLEDKILTYSGRSQSMHKMNISKMWTAAQAKSKLKNKKSWRNTIID